MTAVEGLAGAVMVFGAVVAATRYKPKQDSRLKLAFILTLAVAGGWLCFGQLAVDPPAFMVQHK